MPAILRLFPADLNFTQRALMVALGKAERLREMRLNRKRIHALKRRVEPDAAQRLDKPGADVAEEVMVARIDALFLGLEVLRQRGLAAGNPVAVRGRVRLSHHPVGQVNLAKV